MFFKVVSAVIKKKVVEKNKRKPKRTYTCENLEQSVIFSMCRQKKSD